MRAKLFMQRDSYELGNFNPLESHTKCSHPIVCPLSCLPYFVMSQSGQINQGGLYLFIHGVGNGAGSFYCWLIASMHIHLLD